MGLGVCKCNQEYWQLQNRDEEIKTWMLCIGIDVRRSKGEGDSSDFSRHLVFSHRWLNQILLQKKTHQALISSWPGPPWQTFCPVPAVRTSPPACTLSRKQSSRHSTTASGSKLLSCLGKRWWEEAFLINQPWLEGQGFARHVHKPQVPLSHHTNACSCLSFE